MKVRRRSLYLRADFTQADYTRLVRGLDSAMKVALQHAPAPTEAQARSWLLRFMREHYFSVWRKMR